MRFIHPRQELERVLQQRHERRRDRHARREKDDVELLRQDLAHHLHRGLPGIHPLVEFCRGANVVEGVHLPEQRGLQEPIASQVEAEVGRYVPLDPAHDGNLAQVHIRAAAKRDPEITSSIF
jgi:hypothetical protein